MMTTDDGNDLSWLDMPREGLDVDRQENDIPIYIRDACLFDGDEISHELRIRISYARHDVLRRAEEMAYQRASEAYDRNHPGNGDAPYYWPALEAYYAASPYWGNVCPTHEDLDEAEVEQRQENERVSRLSYEDLGY